MEQERPDPDNSEKIFKVILYARDILTMLAGILKKFSIVTFSVAASLFVLLFTFYIGFIHNDNELIKIRIAFRTLLIVLFFSRLVVGILSLEQKRFLSLGVRIAVLLFALFVILSNKVIQGESSHFRDLFHGDGMVIIACFLIGMLDVSRLFNLISSVDFPPALVFSMSFLIIILLGSGLLMLPNSRTGPMIYSDVLFTSVSAVCVTGLTVTSTAASFTFMGKIIIICLIQLGGLGMMTFTGFFSYIFTSRSTFQERMLLQDIFSSESLGNLFKILIKIILFTFLTEAAGGLIIYFSLDKGLHDKVFFSIFHSVSAFCNAGFSTLNDGLMSSETQRNYLLLSTLTFLIIAGGLGFPVMLRLYSVVKSRIVFFIDQMLNKRNQSRRERLDASSKIVLVATLVLILSGTLILFILESKDSMHDMTAGRQLFLSYFNSVTSRTAGFNMSNLNLLGYPAVLLLICLMWIGASPGSTGGGIKTSTFAIAILSAWGSVRGRKNLEIARREISHVTVIRVLSIIMLSILVIGAGFFFLLISDPSKNPVHLLFEAVSAFSTTGLSLADTSTLSNPGKAILMLLMFIGRVGPLTLLTGLFFAGRRKYYQYPGGDIAIN